ncbi:hypothetical protein OS493_013442 [Desmophyllum pertusum]|uniref:Protein kinase domain-containing protein n=1 Tax=Desmophyllum pertusum TaxID=174260 RepID=A0A9W9YDY9_9CNID|nr:hypothetical protein OS493_013442 [Desmophyllum pertusum]
MAVLGHWLLNGHDEDISLKGSPSFIEGRCLGSKALFLNQSNSFARTPIINLNGRSFTIAFWIKQTRWVLDELAAIYSDDWWDPWQFQLSTQNQEIIISRHAKGYEDHVSLGGTKVTLDTWTHVAVTWEHVTGSVLIYADGKEIGKRLYPARTKFFEPTGNPYQIGNVGSEGGNNQFYGSVMDLYVFGTALSLDQINKLRGPVAFLQEYGKKLAPLNVLMLSVKMVEFGVSYYRKHDQGSNREDRYCRMGTSLEGTCPVLRYTVYYREVLSPAIKSKWHLLTANRNTTSYTLHLNCRKEYDIAVTSLTTYTESALNDSKIWSFKIGGDKNNTINIASSRPTNFEKSPASESGNVVSSSQLAGLVAGLGVLLIIIVTFVIIFSLRRKARKNKQLTHRARRSKSTIIPLWRWEVLPEQVVFKEEIGRGAFGKVLKGTFKESPGIDVFYEPRTQIVDFKAGLTVAIKVLGEKTDEEARNQFLEEIELMKVIGSHRNVVNMLGCWVKSDPIFLLLEYVPYGDLLHWLRKQRMQKSYQRHYYNDGNHLTVHLDIDDESKALLVENEQENMELAYCDKPAMNLTNKDVLDSQENTVEGAEIGEEGRSLNDCDKESTPVSQNDRHGKEQSEEGFRSEGSPLLCVANSARNAARNVLLGEDRVVKISDFGLMRQTHEDVYKLKKGKKIPVKWLAPEALYNSEYTTKSDV